MALFKTFYKKSNIAVLLAVVSLIFLFSCNSNKKEWQEYEQSAEYAKTHPNQKGFDSLLMDGKFNDAAGVGRNYSAASDGSADASKSDPYSKGYQIGFDSGLSDGRNNSRGANASSIDPQGLGFYGANAVKYQEGYNVGYEDGYERSQEGFGDDQASAESDKEKARSANANYMKTTGAEIAKEEAKARAAAENEVKARQAEREKRKQEIEKEAYEKVKGNN